MFRPLLVVKTNQAKLPWIIHTIPKQFRKFVCCIVATDGKKVHLGSGTFVGNCVLSASHIFTTLELEKAYVYCYVDENIIASVPINSISLFPEVDIAQCKLTIPPYITPIALLTETREIPAKEMRSFGCPQGIFGIVWKPKVISQTEDFLVTQGITVPGISGGGIYAKINGRWHILAIHSFAEQSNNTLYSRTIP